MVVPCGGGASLCVGRLGRVGGDSDGCPMWVGLLCMWADWGGWEVTVMVVPCGGGASQSAHTQRSPTPHMWADWGGWEVTVMVVPCGGGASLYVGRLRRVGGDSDGCPMWGWGFSVCGQTGEGGR